MENDIWTEEHLPAVLNIAGNRYKIGLTYRGNVIRKKKKKSYHILFQKPYLVNGAHEIHLNAEFEDVSLSRNKLSLDFFDRIGIISPHSKHVFLSINGFNKGIYLELESFDQHLLKKRNLAKGPIIYATNYHANFSLLTPENKLKSSLAEGYTIKNGKKEDLVRLENFIAEINTLSNEEFETVVSKTLNIIQYLTWLSGVVCTQNFDGFIHNYALYQNGETNLFEMTPWDYDGTWGRDLHGRPLDHDFVPITGYNTLTGRLLHYQPYRQTYKEIMTSVLKNHFNIEQLESIVDGHFKTLIPYIGTDPYLNMDEEQLKIEKEFILDFIQKRNSFLTEKLVSLRK